LKATEIAIILIIGTLTLLVFVLFLVLIVIEYRKRQVRHITEKLELKHQYQNEVMQTQLEVQEQSFKYISEELHDNIAQTLSLVRLKLYRTADKATDQVLKQNVEGSNELLGNVLDGLRNLSHVLNGSLVSKLGLQESLEKELSYVRDVNEMQADMSIIGTVYELPAEKRLLVFRIVQEAINNAIKHGKARRLNIILVYQTYQLTLKIEDNGRGFDTSKINDSKGLGLQNIYVRAKLLGSVDIQSEEGKGTFITLNINTNEQ
jgi:two-component system, NarL family, sensor kinase